MYGWVMKNNLNKWFRMEKIHRKGKRGHKRDKDNYRWNQQVTQDTQLYLWTSYWTWSGTLAIDSEHLKKNIDIYKIFCLHSKRTYIGQAIGESKSAQKKEKKEKTSDWWGEEAIPQHSHSHWFNVTGINCSYNSEYTWICSYDTPTYPREKYHTNSTTEERRRVYT